MASLRNAGMSSAVFGEEFDSGIIAIGFIGCGISFTIYQKNDFVITHAFSKWWNVVLRIWKKLTEQIDE